MVRMSSQSGTSVLAISQGVRFSVRNRLLFPGSLVGAFTVAAVSGFATANVRIWAACPTFSSPY